MADVYTLNQLALPLFCTQLLPQQLSSLVFSHDVPMYQQDLPVSLYLYLDSSRSIALAMARSYCKALNSIVLEGRQHKEDR